MSINPARSFGSAIAAGSWGSFWLYNISPIAGVQLSAFLFRKFYFGIFGQCKSMKCFMSGQQISNRVYHVYSWWQKNEKCQTLSVYAPQKEEPHPKTILIQY